MNPAHMTYFSTFLSTQTTTLYTVQHVTVSCDTLIPLYWECVWCLPRMCYICINEYKWMINTVYGFWYYTSVPSGKACPKLLEDNFPPRLLMPIRFPDTSEEEDGPLDDNKLVWLVCVAKESPLLLTPADPPEATPLSNDPPLLPLFIPWTKIIKNKI